MKHNPMRQADIARRLANRPAAEGAVGGHKGRRRCRMHGGATSSGGPEGNRNGNSSTGSVRANPKRFVELRAEIRKIQDLIRATG